MTRQDLQTFLDRLAPAVLVAVLGWLCWQLAALFWLCWPRQNRW